MPKTSGIIIAQAQLSANPSAPPSGYAYLFPKTDGKWYMMDPAGVVLEVGNPAAVNPWTMVKTTADLSRNTTATLADDSTLIAALSASTAYHVRIKVFFSSANATMDFKFALNYTGTTTAVTCRRSFAAAGATAGTDNENTLMSNALPGSTSATATTSGIGWVEIDLVIITGTAGTLSFQWAQNTSDAGALIRLRGSYLEYMTT